MKINVAVIFGGRSVEHEVSIISALQTMAAIDDEKYQVFPVYISKQGDWFTGEGLRSVENFKNLPELLKRSQKILVSHHSDDHPVYKYPPTGWGKKFLTRIDVAFPVMHGTNGEDGSLQGMLEMMNIPYVGCNVLASALGMDKITMKMVLQAAELPILKYQWFYSRHWLQDSKSILQKIEKEIPYPVIVKPANLGSSVGINKAASREELTDAIEFAASFSDRVVVEEMVRNLREINCSVLGDHDGVAASVCEEPISSADILSYQDKYITKGSSKGMSSAKRKLPAEIPTEQTARIQELAKKTFLALYCSGVARVDFLIDKATNKVYVNEINTIPGSLSFYLWEATGKPFKQLTDDMIQLALKRQREKSRLTFTYESNILSGNAFQGIKK